MAITRARIDDHIPIYRFDGPCVFRQQGSVYLVKAQLDRAIKDFDEVIKL